MTRSIALFCCVLLLQPAADGREWTSAKGAKLTAELVKIEAQAVGLLVAKKVVMYPISGLSAVDQDYVQVQAKGTAFKPGLMPFVPLAQHFAETPKQLFSGGGAAEIYRNNKNRDASLVDSIAVESGETFLARLPTGYDGTTACGLLVYLVPSQNSHAPSGWQAAADKLNLILACPQRAGVETPVLRRLRLALDTLTSAKAQFNVDPAKCILGGMQGGGGVAKSATAMSEGQVLGWAGWDEASPPSDFFSSNVLKRYKWAPMLVKHQFYDRDLKGAAPWPTTGLTYQLFDVSSQQSLSEASFTAMMKFLGL